jgi:hypothetical protein
MSAICGAFPVIVRMECRSALDGHGRRKFCFEHLDGGKVTCLSTVGISRGVTASSLNVALQHSINSIGEYGHD